MDTYTDLLYCCDTVCIPLLLKDSSSDYKPFIEHNKNLLFNKNGLSKALKHKASHTTRTTLAKALQRAAAVLLFYCLDAWLTEYGSQFNCVWVIVFSFQAAISILGKGANDGESLRFVGV